MGSPESGRCLRVDLVDNDAWPVKKQLFKFGPINECVPVSEALVALEPAPPQPPEDCWLTHAEGLAGVLDGDKGRHRVSASVVSTSRTAVNQLN